MTTGSATLDPTFLMALASVRPEEWSAWFSEPFDERVNGASTHRTLAAIFPMPAAGGHAAICVFERPSPDAGTHLAQAALRRWAGNAPAGTQVLHTELASDGSANWTLGSAWSDPDLRAWLREALTAGAALRTEGWEWIAAPESPAAGRSVVGPSHQITARRHDAVRFGAGAIGIVYRQLARGGQPELELLRHLERVPGLNIAPSLLGSAIIIAPNGQRSASAILQTTEADADSARAMLVERLQQALGNEPSLTAAALDDVRAAGLITRELHAALARPFEQGVIAGAAPATLSEFESWAARVWDVLGTAARAARRHGAVSADPTLGETLDLLPGKLQQFVIAAQISRGLAHRIHGSLSLDTLILSPSRRPRVMQFDGDPELPDAERMGPQSPWRDAACMLVSIAQLAAEAAAASGGSDATVEAAWQWEREARKAYLEGYGTGGGVPHALIAMFELEFAARALRDSTSNDAVARAVAAHTLHRLTRTIV